MKTFFELEPDRINKSDNLTGGRRATYHFWYLPPGRKDNEICVKFTVVTSPARDAPWQATLWQHRENGYVVLNKRDLTPDEIGHFEQRIANLKTGEAK